MGLVRSVKVRSCTPAWRRGSGVSIYLPAANRGWRAKAAGYLVGYFP